MIAQREDQVFLVLTLLIGALAGLAVVAFIVKSLPVTTRLAWVLSPTYASVSEVTLLDVDALPMPTRPPPLFVACAFVRDGAAWLAYLRRGGHLAGTCRKFGIGDAGCDTHAR